VARLVYYADLEHAFDDPGRIGRLAALVEDLRTPETLVCGGGDNTAPGVLAMKDDRVAALPFFRAVRPDADTLGNHEFDRSLADAAALLRESPQTWVCANLADREFLADAAVAPWTVLESGAERVGLFGVASPDTDEISPRAAGLTFTDPVDAAREAVEALRDRGVDHVVGLSHVGDDAPLARALDVPVVLGGHVHDRREEVVDGTLLLRPGPVGKRIADVTVDADGASVTWHRTADADVDPDPALVSTYRDRLADLGLDEVVATLDEPVPRVANDGESPIGNFAADAIRRAAGADVGLMHGGSIRQDDPLAGRVTVADLVSLVPFENEVVRATVPGDRLRETFREAAGADRDLPDPRRWYGQVSNVELVWDHAAGRFREARIDGDPVDPDATYTLATVDYVVRPEGLFASLDPSLSIESVGSIHDVLVEHARSPGIPTETDGRIERLNLPAPDAA